MANLLGFASRIGNTINNDVFKPINRDVLQPAGSVAQSIFTKPVESSVIEPSRSLLASATGNQAAFNAAQARQSAAQSASFTGQIASPYANLINTDIIAPSRALLSGNGGNAQAFVNRPDLNVKQVAGNSVQALLPFVAPEASKLAGKLSGPLADKVSSTLLKSLITAGTRVATESPLGAAYGASGTYANDPNATVNQALANAKQTAALAGVLSTTPELAQGFKKAVSTVKGAAPAATPLVAKSTSAAPAPKQIEVKTPAKQIPVTAGKADTGPALPQPSYGGTAGKAVPLASKITALKQIGTDSAVALSDKVKAIVHDSGDLTGNYHNLHQAASNLSKAEYQNLGNVVEHGATPISDAVAKAVPAARASFDQVIKDYRKAGGQLTPRQNYFARDYSGVKAEDIVKHLMDSGQTKTLEQARSVASNLKGTNTKPGFFGSFDKARYDVPGYTYSKNATTDYFNRAADRTATTQHFGAKGQIADQLIKNVGAEGGDSATAGRAVENFLRAPESQHPIIDKAAAGVRGAYGAVRLSKAALSHAGQDSNIALVTRAVDSAKGQLLRATKGGRDFVRASNVNNPKYTHGLRSQESGLKGVASKITAPGLNTVMEKNRGDAALAGRSFGQWLAKKGDSNVPFTGKTGVGELRRLGVTGDIVDGKLSLPQQYQIARGVANETMFNPSRAFTPIGAETTGGKTVGQYRTAYGYKQTGLINDKVIKPTLAGNLRPAAKFLAGSVPVAGATIAAKNVLSGKKEGPGGIAMDAVGALGGIPGELAVSGARYGSRNILKTVASAIAPAAGEAVDIGQRAQKAISGNLKPAESYLAGLVPGAGPWLSKSINPPPATVKAGSSADLKAKGTAEAKALQPSAGNDTTIQKLSNGKFAYTLDDGQTVVHQVDSLKKAQQDVAKYTFGKSGDSYKVSGDTVYRKAADGTVSTMTKTVYDYKLGTATLVSQKASNDLGGWMKTAASQLDSIQKQLKDPNIDPLDAATLQNEADTLISNAQKYTDYGGFTKPKAAKSVSVASLATASKSNAPKPKGIAVKKLATPSFSAGAQKKYSVSSIPTTYRKKAIA